VQWIYKGSPPPKKPKTQNSLGKLMAAVMKGILLIEYLTKGATITGQLYNDQKIMLLRDNCRVHKARQIREVRLRRDGTTSLHPRFGTE
jgi:hypothetical protein